MRVKNRKEGLAAAAIAGAVLGISCVWGNYDRGQELALRQKESQTVAETSQESRLSQSQLGLLEEIFAALEQEDMELGASLLLGSQEELAELFYQTMEGERFLYREGGVSPEIEGEGLVLAMQGWYFAAASGRDSRRGSVWLFSPPAWRLRDMIIQRENGLRERWRDRERLGISTMKGRRREKPPGSAKQAVSIRI